MIERTTVRLPSELLSRYTNKALAERRTWPISSSKKVSRLVTNDNQKKPRSKRVLPRYSDAAGGPLPGIDISDSAALQEMDDLEYVERMKHFK